MFIIMYVNSIKYKLLCEINNYETYISKIEIVNNNIK